MRDVKQKYPGDDRPAHPERGRKQLKGKMKHAFIPGEIASRLSAGTGETPFAPLRKLGGGELTADSLLGCRLGFDFAGAEQRMQRVPQLIFDIDVFKYRHIGALFGFFESALAASDDDDGNR
jgi:hypothetical protein